ncbi:hypothetical protein EUGRSUZ_I00104 [Eucalyptus grandis]|uniref:tRNA pseudouridine synthase n=2 Tax=Eucalyptus grandis TaxID=71139 RepID=A0A059AL36_EUCGR|nr:hypothetical protein EUGRSUZ_I00104 [Eucalyptus grandis]
MSSQCLIDKEKLIQMPQDSERSFVSSEKIFSAARDIVVEEREAYGYRETSLSPLPFFFLFYRLCLAGVRARSRTSSAARRSGREAMSTSPDADSVDALRSQIHSLHKTINELEKQNADLSSRLSGCCCQKMEDKNGCVVEGSGVVNGNGKSMKLDKKTRKKKDFKTGILEHHPRRYVALRLMYFGQRFYGFASEAQLDPTVESEIFKALEKTKLLVVGDKKKSQYSRCGRTDKGVSSFGQVISLFLRSNLRPKNTDDANNWGLSIDRDVLDAEIDYVRVLNRVLPKDIRVTGWFPVPIDFSARFSCMSRDAGQKFVGDHDFRNFFKMDAFDVHNYRCHITSFELSSCDKRLESNELWCFKIKGSAFLWHQVHCMVAVMFMVGQGLESPDVRNIRYFAILCLGYHKLNVGNE